MEGRAEGGRGEGRRGGGVVELVEFVELFEGRGVKEHREGEVEVEGEGEGEGVVDEEGGEGGEAVTGETVEERSGGGHPTIPPSTNR